MARYDRLAPAHSPMRVWKVAKLARDLGLFPGFQQIDHLIAALEAGENVDPKRIERVLKRARVVQ